MMRVRGVLLTGLLVASAIGAGCATQGESGGPAVTLPDSTVTFRMPGGWVSQSFGSGPEPNDITLYRNGTGALDVALYRDAAIPGAENDARRPRYHAEQYARAHGLRLQQWTRTGPTRVREVEGRMLPGSMRAYVASAWSPLGEAAISGGIEGGRITDVRAALRQVLQSAQASGKLLFPGVATPATGVVPAPGAPEDGHETHFVGGYRLDMPSGWIWEEVSVFIWTFDQADTAMLSFPVPGSEGASWGALHLKWADGADPKEFAQLSTDVRDQLEHSPAQAVSIGGKQPVPGLLAWRQSDFKGPSPPVGPTGMPIAPPSHRRCYAYRSGRITVSAVLFWHGKSISDPAVDRGVAEMVRQLVSQAGAGFDVRKP